MLLADLGARVVKIERPGRGDDTRAWGPPFVGGESAYFLSTNRNKESVTLDLKHPAARPVIDRLLARTDVLVENFRPGTLDSIGLGADAVTAAHPRLIYCSISGFGQGGPRRDEAGYDAVVQAESGLMSITGDADGPPFRLGVAIADLATGMFAAQGILAALIARGRTGRGQRLDIAMLDAAASLLTYQAEMCLAAGITPQRMGNRHPTIVPYETFAAADGTFVLAVGNDALFTKLCEVIGRPELASDPRFATNPARVEHRDALRPPLAEAFLRWTRRELVERLNAAGVPCGSVRSVAEALADPQLSARGMIVVVEHPTAGDLRVLGTPLKLSDTPAAVRTAPPLLGGDTDRVLSGELGFSAGEVAALRAAGAV
jgi:crotonobetainyl-CoA:carnitine CoA-transferase CaiB-like acyl-CoA transferase